MLHHSYKFESVSSNLTTPPLSIIKKLKNAIKSQCLVSLKRKRPTSTKSSNSSKNPENGFRKGVIKYSCHLIHSIFIHMLSFPNSGQFRLETDTFRCRIVKISSCCDGW